MSFQKNLAAFTKFLSAEKKVFESKTCVIDIFDHDHELYELSTEKIFIIQLHHLYNMFYWANSKEIKGNNQFYCFEHIWVRVWL